ncbi:cold shock domain-containing protein [Dermatobacter hominis]|uniref:cold shock domain-containing protein n=1 Tax=Dermatobacter hominis TaxID=2884263 RepID=UPI001D125ECA|nr:cold shock domain-containing protein [Dermatobacter hominis]UDY36217.1 cold shock domain-containing protein [Dermatobacter hominis]
MATSAPVIGTVVAFDREVGLGTVRADDGTELTFHATAISDGSRDIAVGTAVLHRTAAGHGGALEARPVTPLPSRS